ncbi:MAG: heparinase II/III family protein [Zoogloeaceae bacterium]|nr:heparinase II/III family protein [Zoogloeaceae bacterium]
MPVHPMQGATPASNPPVFTWPAGGGPYAVEIEAADGKRFASRTPRNWLTLDHALPAGPVRWRWQGQQGQAALWHAFNVDRSAAAFTIPDGAALLARVRSRPHPRSVSIASLSQRAGAEATAAARIALARWQSMPLPAELPVASGLLAPARQNALLAENRRLVFDEEHRLLTAAWLWLATGDPPALAEARRRALHIATWDANGMTGFTHHDQAGRSVAWMLALSFDWLYDSLTDSERIRLLQAIRPRLEGMLGIEPFGIDRSFRLDRNPYDSHGVTAAARTSLICSILAGKDDFFDSCFRDVVPRYLAWPVPWGREDGGFANGTAYAHWGLLDTHLPVAHLLSQTLGIDLLRQPWIKGYGRFIAYFLPPGAPTGLFGDETEKRFANVWATQAKAYAAHLPSPMADWYARNQFGENPLHLALLLAPARDWNAIPGTLPAGTPRAVHLADIGWVAMHSDLSDRARTSVYFKASPYGSYNHSHADQNSFVIHARGQALAIDSGYYDFYGSPHWKDWYKQTRAHNAITFDGGQGQLHDTMKAKGRITRFEHHADYDLATGDAAAAYGGALTRAVRSVVYLRPDTVLVHDSLASETPRTWEWNLHALSKMKVKGARGLEIEQEGVRLCATLLESPEGAFEQTDRFATPPQGAYRAQWHARYTSGVKSRQARFLALLDVDCRGIMTEVRADGSRLIVDVGVRKFTFDQTGFAGVAP